jgi:hypothetical protein
MQRQMIRQGDVLLIPRKPLSAAERRDARPVPRDHDRVILAYGEVTGHAHVITDADAALYDLGIGRVVECAPHAMLRHDEHAALGLDGTYCVIRQREYTPEAIRNVAD